jgi:hypothetical protein
MNEIMKLLEIAATDHRMYMAYAVVMGVGIIYSILGKANTGN